MSLFSESRLESDYEAPYNAWKVSDTPQTRAALISALQPDIESAVYAHTREKSPLVIGRAKQLVLGSLGRYDPKRGKLRTFVHEQAKGVQRYAGQQRQILKTPERIVLDRNYLEEQRQSLRDELGREPSDEELMDSTGFSPRRLSRIRQFIPGVAASAFSGIEGGDSPAVSPWNIDHVWLQLVYDEASPLDKKILEWSLGLGGNPKLSGEEIASRLNRSAGAISQRKARLQKRLDEWRPL